MQRESAPADSDGARQREPNEPVKRSCIANPPNPDFLQTPLAARSGPASAQVALSDAFAKARRAATRAQGRTKVKQLGYIFSIEVINIVENKNWFRRYSRIQNKNINSSGRHI
jgi:hypothetical protein